MAIGPCLDPLPRAALLSLWSLACHAQVWGEGKLLPVHPWGRGGGVSQQVTVICAGRGWAAGSRGVSGLRGKPEPAAAPGWGERRRKVPLPPCPRAVLLPFQLPWLHVTGCRPATPAPPRGLPLSPVSPRPAVASAQGWCRLRRCHLLRRGVRGCEGAPAAPCQVGAAWASPEQVRVGGRAWADPTPSWDL